MKVLYVSSEALPFATSGGLGDVAGSLPQALQKKRVGCRIVMPLYETVPQAMRDEMRFVTSFMVPVSWRSQYCGVFEAKAGGVTYYLLDNEYYFKRAALYGHFDDAERFAFFARAVLELLVHINFWPDVIHANDWQTALVPVYLDLFYRDKPAYQAIKTVFTIHNIQYQGMYDRGILGDVFGIRDAQYSLLEFGGAVNLMKGAIECANRVTTVSPTYAQEILDPWFSHGLDPILRERAGKLCGILNGIDTVHYNPETDAALAAPFSAANPAGKAKNKAALQKEFGLPQKKATPVLGMVTRLVTHKGLDLVREVLFELLQTTDIQLVVLGTGEKQYEDLFSEAAARFGQQVGLHLGFAPALARRIYAGSDLFLMPSKSEPCGLSQMIALRYGTVPIVRETGGLKDSVFDSADGEGNGFTFASYNAHDMLHAIRRAQSAFHTDGWSILVQRALNCDYSWNNSAKQYMRLYREVVG